MINEQNMLSQGRNYLPFDIKHYKKTYKKNTILCTEQKKTIKE